MLPQFSFLEASQSRLKACHPRAPSRCQRVWQGILILAALALALAQKAEAQSAPLCYDLFSGLSAPFRSGNTVVIHFNFARLTANGLSSENVQRRIRLSAEREIRVLESELAQLKGTSAKVIATRAELTSRLKNTRHIAELAKSGGRLNQQELSLIADHDFELKFAMNGKSGREILESTLADLQDNIASIKKVDLPKGALRRVIHVANQHKVMTFILVATVSSAGGSVVYQIYSAPTTLNGKLTPVYQDCGLNDSCSNGAADVGVDVSRARAVGSKQKAAGPASPSAILNETGPSLEHAHDDPSLAIGN